MNLELVNSIRILGFREEYRPIDQDKPMLGKKRVEYVDFTSVGNGKYTVVPMRIVDAQRDTSGLWEIIGPKYEAWKIGTEIPETGTPLAAWHGVTKEQADVLRAASIRTVEDIANMPEVALERIALPNLRSLKLMAQKWCEASDTRVLHTEIARRDEELETLKQQMADLMEAVQQSAEEPKRGPGRPRKADAEAA